MSQLTDSLIFNCIVKGLLVLASILVFSTGQQPDVNYDCTPFFRNVRRGGMYVVGRLEIPLEDEQSLRYKLRLRFSRSIHQMNIKQMQAKDMGSHKEFLLDPMEQVSNGNLQLNAVIRMRSMMGPTPKLTRLVFNNRALCGDALTQEEISESVVIQVPRLSSTTQVAIITPSTQKSKVANATEDEEDYFEEP